MISFTDDPGVPLRNTTRALQLPANRIKPAGALLLRAQRDRLGALGVLLVDAHVHVEGCVGADAEGDAAGLDGRVVGVGLFGCVDEGDRVLARAVRFGMAYCVLL